MLRFSHPGAFACWVKMSNANELLILALLLSVSACHAGKDTTVLSERYRVCANLPSGASFHSDPPGPDFDIGTLQVDGLEVQVMIGGHPGFSQQVRMEGLEAKNGFKFIGREQEPAQDRILFAYNRDEKSRPLFARFSAASLKPVETLLNTKDFLVDCKWVARAVTKIV